jgi:hypothetical protein
MKTCSKCVWFEMDVDPAFNDYNGDGGDEVGLCHAPLPITITDYDTAFETEPDREASKCPLYKKYKKRK